MRNLLVVLALAVFACGGDRAPKPPPAAAVATPMAGSAAALPRSTGFPRHYPIVIDAVNVRAIDASADGRRIAAGGEEGGAVVVELPARTVVRRIAGEGVRGVALAADGGRVAVTTADGLALYDVASGKRLARRAGAHGRIARCGSGYVVAEAQQARLLDAELRDAGVLAAGTPLGIHGPVACHGDVVALATRTEILVFGRDDRALRARMRADHGDVNGIVDVALGPRHAAAISNTGTVWLFAHDGTRVAMHPHVAGQAQTLAFTPDGAVLAAGGVLLGVPDLAILARTPSASARRFLPDGAWLVTAGTYDLAVIDVAGLGEPAGPIDGHLDTAHALAIDPTGKLLASGATGRVYLWNLDDARPDLGPGPLVAVLEAHEGGVFGRVAVAFAPDGRLYSAGNGTVSVWDPRTRARLATWRVGDHEGELSLAVDAAHVVVGGSNHVYVLDPTTGATRTRVGSFKLPDGFDGSVESVALVPGGKHVAITSHGGKLGVFDLATGAAVAQRTAEAKQAEARVIVAPDGRRAFELGSREGKVWTLPGLGGGTPFEIGWVADVAWSADGRSFAWGSWSGSGVGVVDVTGTPRARWEQRTPWHTAAVAWDHRRGVIYSTGADLAIHVWDAASGARRATWSAATGPHFEQVVFSADRRLLATAQYGMLRLWDLATFTQVAYFDDVYGLDRGTIRVVGDRLLALSEAGVLRRWARTGGAWRELAPWRPADAYGWTGVGITADGATAYALDGTGTLAVIDTATAKVTATRELGGVDAFGHAQVDPRGRYLVLQLSDDASTLEIWDIARGKRVHRAARTGERPEDVAFVGDEIELAPAGEEDEIVRVALATGKRRVPCPRDDRDRLGVEDDGARLVYRRGALRVRSSRSCTDELALYVDHARSAAIGGDRLVVAGDGTLVVWDLTTREIVATLRALRDGLWSARTAAGYVAPARTAVPKTK